MERGLKNKLADTSSVEQLVKQCAEAIDNRRTGDDQSYRPEDIQLVRKYFSKILAKQNQDDNLQKERTDVDILTGALSRHAFLLQAEQLIAESDDRRKHAFLLLDIDGFKTVNDMYGHPVGDIVLSDLARTLRTILREKDLFGRIGGDEFMICLKDIPHNTVVEKKAAKINLLMRRKFNNGAAISGSIGIAVFPHDGDNYDLLYNKADIALYHSKENGKDQYHFYKDGMTHRYV